MSDLAAKPRYHHGDLPAALLSAAEAELTASGVEGFSLRAVAKRAGVSHAAPAHHFGDAQGLLTALCAEGFRRFLATQHAREALAPPDPRAQIIAAGLGYIDFAMACPALFRLMFSSDRPRRDTAELHEAGRAAFGHLVAQVAVAGGQTGTDGRVTADVAALWAIAHGLADLCVSGALHSLTTLPATERDAVVTAIIARALPT